MLSCWNENPDKRPSFLQLHSRLNQLSEENQVLNANTYKIVCVCHKICEETARKPLRCAIGPSEES